ncbi:hypothetical protein EXIGLDRAFT_746001 [Exidia glandulosa HHB12029]|uniref:Uncharacterized protein n=1 Tax=Exidia glandulosa HHB12029 TaxID=1314781 RepID=A0A165MTU2_EXIGL|nr:hypothetical protein EXIGLDRAFT_746001 [Exidia glandulosa HHB12029]
MPQTSYQATHPLTADSEARQRINIRAMRQSRKPVLLTSLLLASLSGSKSLERVRATLVIFTGVGSFGAAVAMSAYYTAATADNPDLVVLTCLAWSFVAYLGTDILALIWQMGNTLYPTIGRYARYFSASGAAVLASYSCILAGTIFLAAALAMSFFVSQWYQIRSSQRKLWGVPTSPNIISRFWKTMLPSFYDERFINQAFAWNDDPTRLFTPKYYAALQRTAETMATTASGRDIAKFLLLGVRFASPAEYVLATAPEDEDGTLDVNEMAERIVYASRAFHATRDVPDAITDVEKAACLEFLHLSKTYGPLVSQLSATDPSFWDSPLEDRTRQVYFLHKASGRATAEDAAVHSATAVVEAPHVIVQMDEEPAGAGNAAEGSTSHDAGLAVPPTVSPSPPTPAQASNSGLREVQQVAVPASDLSMTGADITLAVRTPLPLHARSVGAIDELDDI